MNLLLWYGKPSHSSVRKLLGVKDRWPSQDTAHQVLLEVQHLPILLEKDLLLTKLKRPRNLNSLSSKISLLLGYTVKV